MTKEDYQQYKKNVEGFFKREMIDTFTCEEDCEPHFSWQPCECCQRTDGGDRHQVSAITTSWLHSKVEFSVCDDCVYYNEYGKLDDLTMLKIEESR